MTTRNACFTLHQPFDLTTLLFRDPLTELHPWYGRIKYLICQEEKCPETGRLHLQGYVELTRSIRFPAIKQLLGFGDHVHLEPRRGNRDQAKAYCEKEESRVSGPYYWPSKEAYGKGGQGRRSDIDDACEELLQHRDMSQLPNSLVVKYHKGFDRLLSLTAKPRKYDPDNPVECIILWGAAGTGKSQEAYRIANNYSTYNKDGDTKWFDGYNGEQCIVVNEFDPVKTEITISMFKKWVDWCPCLVQPKGGYTQLLATKWIWTSNVDPRNWFRQFSDSAQRGAFLRRISLCRKYSADGSVVTDDLNDNGYIEPLVGPYELVNPINELPY